MSLWGRAMLHFFPQRQPASEASEQVEAAFERMVCARIQVGEVAADVAKTARAHNVRVSAERAKIRERTAETAAKYPTGRTSQIRNLVGDMLESLDRPKDNEGRGS